MVDPDLCLEGCVVGPASRMIKIGFGLEPYSVSKIVVFRCSNPLTYGICLTCLSIHSYKKVRFGIARTHGDLERIAIGLDVNLSHLCFAIDSELAVLIDFIDSGHASNALYVVLPLSELELMH